MNDRNKEVEERIRKTKLHSINLTKRTERERERERKRERERRHTLFTELAAPISFISARLIMLDLPSIL